MGYNHINNCTGKLKIINVSSRLERLMPIKLSLAYWTMIFFLTLCSFLIKGVSDRSLAPCGVSAVETRVRSCPHCSLHRDISNCLSKQPLRNTKIACYYQGISAIDFPYTLCVGELTASCEAVQLNSSEKWWDLEKHSAPKELCEQIFVFWFKNWIDKWVILQCADVCVCTMWTHPWLGEMAVNNSPCAIPKLAKGKVNRDEVIYVRLGSY